MGAGGFSSAIAIAGLGLGLGLAACDDNDDKRSKSSLTKPQYIARADAVCDQSRKAAGTIPRAQNSAQEIRNMKASIARTTAVMRKLKALGVPEDLSQPMQRYFALSTQINGHYREAIRLLPQAERTSDFNDYNGVLSKVEQNQVKRTKALGPAGFKVCASANRFAGYLPAAFQKRVDAICAVANRSIARAAGGTNKYGAPLYPSDLKGLARVYAASLPDGQNAARQLRALPAPKVNAESWQAFVAAYDERIRAAALQFAAARAGSQKGYDAASEKDVAGYEKERAAAQKLGLEVCGVSSPSNT